MTRTDPQDLAGELAYVKTLAEEGRNAPLVGGAIYLIWGVVIAAASLLNYFAFTGALSLPFFGGLWFWVAAFAAGWGSSIAYGARRRGAPGALTIGNKTASAAWLAVGLFLSIFWIAAMAFRGHFTSVGIEPGYVFGLIFPIAFGAYGIAFFATAVAARLDWMRGFAGAAWIFSIAALYFIGDEKQFLIGAAGSLVCAALPGVLLMRREPSDTI